VKVPVRVHAYPDGTLAVFHGPRCLARYHADGQLIDRPHTPSRGPDRRRIVPPAPIVREIFST
jgi:hypothetical protein